MDMSTYLSEVEHAATSLITILWSEHKAVEASLRILRPLEVATDEGYSRAKFIIDNDFDDEGLGTSAYWDTYFGPDKDRFHAAADLESAKVTLDTRTFSRASVASAILQFAKQGLSTVHGTPKNAPSGRTIMGEELKNIVWQGRNQALHWEEGNPHKAVAECFNNLSAVDPRFANFMTTSMAFEVISILKWDNWSDFKNDLISLG
jgi:hypothetical protein